MREKVIDLKSPTIFDKGPTARIGLVQTSNGMTSYNELLKILPSDYGLYANRVKLANPINIENLLGVGDGLPDAAANVLPDVKVDALVYSCTSGAMVLGRENTSNLLRKHRPDVQITSDPFTASVSALRSLGCRRITVLTPYIREANEKMMEALEEHGFEVLCFAGFGLEVDEDIIRTPYNFIKDTALQIFDPDSDALFISCVSLVVVDHVKDLEETLGCPVVTANQAMGWHLLQMIAREKNLMPPQVKGYGELFYHNIVNDDL